MRSDWGSVTELKKGVWRIRYWADSEKGYRRLSKTVHGTRVDANDALAALRLDHSKDAPTPTMNDCWKRWLLPYYEKRVENGDMSEQSLKQYISFWNKHIKPRWGSYEVDTIRPIAVQQWLDTKSASLAGTLQGICKKAVNFACRYEFSDKNVFAIEYILPPKISVQKRPNTVWTLSQLLDLLQVTKKEAAWLLPSFILCAFGSCRTGESWGVKQKDIELVDIDGLKIARISIERQINQNNIVTNKLKNPQSKRIVLVPDELAIFIAKLKGEFIMQDPIIGTMPTRHAQVIHEKWEKIIKKAKVPKGHYGRLRASWRTFMQDEFGLPPDMLEKMMGHKGTGVTNAHYYRPQADVYTKTYVEAYKKYPFAKDLGLFGTKK